MQRLSILLAAVTSLYVAVEVFAPALAYARDIGQVTLGQVI